MCKCVAPLQLQCSCSAVSVQLVQSVQLQLQCMAVARTRNQYACATQASMRGAHRREQGGRQDTMSECDARQSDERVGERGSYEEGWQAGRRAAGLCVRQVSRCVV